MRRTSTASTSFMAEVFGPEETGPAPPQVLQRQRVAEGKPSAGQLDLSIIFEKESDVPKTNIPELCSTILSMLRYVQRQRPTIEELLQDPSSRH